MKLTRTTIVILVLFILSGVISWSTFLKDYSQQDTVSIHEFPMQIGPWSAEELVITEREYEVLETRNAFTRKYTTPDGKEVYLFIVYSQTNRKVSHPPEICYSGGGATILSNVHRDIPGVNVPANKVTVEMAKFQQLMYYFFKVGDTFTSNYWKQQFLVAMNSLLGRDDGQALVRLSANIKPGAADQTAQNIEEFVSTILPYLNQYLP